MFESYYSETLTTSEQELLSNTTYWEEIAQRNPSSGKNEIPGWIRERVSIFPCCKRFRGQFKAKSFIRIAPAKSVQEQRVM